MKDNFESCLALTLKYEGGYSNHPRDPGGPTNLGITIATLSHELGRAATIADVTALTREKVAPIYARKYWNLVDGDDQPAGVDALLFDIAVNSGPGRALAWDRATRGLAPLARVRALDARRRSFYRGLSTFDVFGRGWMAREKDVFARALAMAQAASPATSPTASAPASTTQAHVSPQSPAKLPTPKGISIMKGYRTYIAASAVVVGGLIAQTDWIAFIANPRAGLVALGSGVLMAFMRSITTTAPCEVR